MNRVHFFFLSICGALCVFFVSCQKKTLPPQSAVVLGTHCVVNAFEDGTAALYDEVFARLRQIDALFSTTNPDSDISRVSAAAGERAVSVSSEVFFVLQTALRIAAQTDGAFDPTIGPLVRCWGINTDDARVPEAADRISALSLVNYHNCVLSEQDSTVFLTQKGMALDLGGIAKGYAADELATILRAHNVAQAIIDLGGNISLFGAKTDGTAWRVGVKNPLEPLGSPALVLMVPSCSVVTSGVYERFFEQDGIRYHHILDAKTGFPANTELLSVTVVDTSSLLADALSTTLFVLGKEKGLSFAEQLGISAIFIETNCRVTTTADIANAKSHVLFGQ